MTNATICTRQDLTCVHIACIYLLVVRLLLRYKEIPSLYLSIVVTSLAYVMQGTDSRRLGASVMVCSPTSTDPHHPLHLSIYRSSDDRTERNLHAESNRIISTSGRRNNASHRRQLRRLQALLPHPSPGFRVVVDYNARLDSICTHMDHHRCARTTKTVPGPRRRSRAGR